MIGTVTLMGCGASVPEAPKGGETVKAASGGKVALSFSDASIALFAVKPSGKQSFVFRGKKCNSDKSGTSSAINDKWGLSKPNPFSIRYWTSADFPKAGDMQSASEASISVGDVGGVRYCRNYVCTTRG